VVRHVDWAVVRCLVIAGPGFTKDAFRAHLDTEAVRRELRRALAPAVLPTMGRVWSGWQRYPHKRWDSHLEARVGAWRPQGGRNLRRGRRGSSERQRNGAARLRSAAGPRAGEGAAARAPRRAARR